MATQEEYRKLGQARKVAMSGGDYKTYERLANKVRQNPTVTQRKQGGVGGVGASLGDSSGVGARTGGTQQDLYSNYSSKPVRRVATKREQDIYGTAGLRRRGFTSVADSPRRTADERLRDKVGNVGFENRNTDFSNLDNDAQEVRFGEDVVTTPTRPQTLSEIRAQAVADFETQRNPTTFESVAADRPESDYVSQAGAFRSDGSRISVPKESSVNSLGAQTEFRGANNPAVQQLAAPREIRRGDGSTFEQVPEGENPGDIYLREVEARNRRVELGRARSNLESAVRRGRIPARFATSQIQKLAEAEAGIGGPQATLAFNKQAEERRKNKAAEGLKRQELYQESIADDTKSSLALTKLGVDQARADQAQANADRKFGLDLAKYERDVAKLGLDQANKNRELGLSAARLENQINQTAISGAKEQNSRFRIVQDAFANELEGKANPGSAKQTALTILGPDVAVQQGLISLEDLTPKDLEQLSEDTKARLGLVEKQ